MKSNLKGGNPIVRFLLAHGEKLGMAAIGVCLLLLVWAAMGVERLGRDRQPDQLLQEARLADEKIQSFRWNDIDEGYKKIARSIPGEMMQPVKQDHFPTIKYPWERSVIDPVGPRTDPELFEADLLEVHGDSGLWASADPDVIEQRMLDAIAEEERMQREEDQERERRGDDFRGGPGPGRGEGREFGRGGLDGGMRGGQQDDRRRRQAGPIVVRPRMGAQLSGGFEEINAKSWITVLARVPIRDQHRQYEDALQTARGYRPELDIPKYLGYEVQRAEITSEGLGPWKVVAQIFDRKIIEEIEEYPVTPPEVVAQRYTHPIMTHPLPPLILKEWDDRVSHSTMPLAIEEMLEDEEEFLDEDLLATADEDADDDPFSRSARLRAQQFAPRGRMDYGERGIEGEYGRGSEGGYRRGGIDSIRGEGGYGPGIRGEMSFEGGRGGFAGRGRFGGQLGMGRRTELPEFMWDGRTSHVLLRYFDTNVEPGHRYRYQVRLVLQDVNRGIPESHLDASVIERMAKTNNSPVRRTVWSEPSPIASVPLPARLFLVSGDPGRRGEPRATVMIKALNARYAAELAREETVNRGAVINVRDKPTVIWSDQYDPDEDPDFNFYTNFTLLDVQGGESLTRELKTPARAIVMDAAGRLIVQDELKDSTPVKEFQEVVETGGDDAGFRGRGIGRGGIEGEY